MRRRIPVLALLLLAALPAGTAAGRIHERCVLPAGATVVARSASLEIQRADDGGASTWTACRRATGRRLVLLRSPDPLSGLGSLTATDFRLQGRFVAFGRTFGERGGGSVTLVRADTAGVGRVEALGPYGPSTGTDSKLTSLQLTSRGVVLFTSDSAYDDDFGRGPTSRLGVADGRGFRLLEVTALGAISRPALTGTTATWAVDGVARSVALAPR